MIGDVLAPVSSKSYRTRLKANTVDRDGAVVLAKNATVAMKRVPMSMTQRAAATSETSVK